MPLVRYEIRNEYSLANPELYGAASKDDPQSLLEGVAMAGLVGIVRQLGDLAEFAAEIFHDLHEEVMATAARGHRLMVRVQQLEAEFPSVEKALMSENNQIRFAYTVGADWHASIRNDQNHLTQGDLPRFILNSYEECRGPPRLFLLDKFDIAGAGACLKRYTDPSFFKMEWASSELMKAEKAQREKKARRVKKKGRRRRNGETPNIVPTSELNSRIRYSSLDLDGPKHVPGNLVSTFSQKLKSKQVNESPVMDQQIRRNYMQGSSFDLYLPKEDDPSPENLPLKPKQVCGSSLQDQVLGRIHLQGPSYMSLHKEDAFKSSSQECEEKPLAGNSHGVQLRDNLDRVPVLESQSLRNGADIEVEKMPDNCMHAVQKDVLVNGERKMVVNADEDHTDDVASEIDNYMDALTTMESEMETDSESRTKHEVDSDINSEHREMGFETSEELHEKHAQCSNFVDTEASADFYNCETSDDSLKAKSSSRFFNMESADGFANVESTIHTVNNMLEDDLANVELPTCLTSASVPVGMSNNESISSLDNSISSVSVVNSLSSESLNNVQIRANEERLSDTDVAPAISVDAVSYTILGKAQTTDALNHGSSAAFANADSVGVSVNAAPSAEVGKGEASFRLAASELSLISTDADLQTPTNKEPLDVLNDGSSAGFANVDNDGVSVTGTPAAELDNGEVPFRLATSELPLASTDVDLRIPTNKEPLDVLNDGSSVGFANVDTAGVSVTGTPASELDKGEASFRLATSVLSFISTDVDLHSPPSKEPLVAAESSPVSSEDMMADVELQIDSLEVDKVDDPVTSVFCADSAINESVVFSCTSESPTGIKNAIMQDEHECIELHPDDAENGASAKHINGESFHSQCTELLPSLSSYEPIGQMSVESDIQIAYNGSPADCRILSDSVHVEFLGPSMDAEVVGDKVCGVLSIDSATPMNSVVALQQNEDPAEYACIKSVPDVMPMEALVKSNLPVDFQDAKMSENDLSKILTAKISSIELVVDSLGNKMTDSVESSNVLVNPHIEDLSDDILVKEMHTDLAQPVPADAVHVELPSANVCREGLPNEFIQAEPDGILGSEIPTVSLNALFSPAFLHSSAAGSHENLVSYESHTDLDTGMPAEVLNVKSPASSFDEKLTVDSLHTYSGTQPCKTLSPAKSVDAAPYVKAESLSNCPRAEAPDTEPPSPPLEHIKISFHPPAESPLSTYATSSDHVSESPSPERYPLYENKTDDLSSSFHLLPEPAIPLQQGAENQTIRDLGSLSLHGRRKSSEIIPDKIQFSQIIDTDDDSENGDSKGFEKSSPNFPGEFCNKPLEPTSELAGFSGMTAINNGDTGSPRVSWSTSMSSSLSPDTTRSSFLPKVKCSSLESGSGASHSSNVSGGSSLRSPIFSALHSPISPEGTYRGIQAFSKSQSNDLESELLVPTSPTLEPKFLASDSLDDMPPLPPLPPLEWRIMKPRQRPSLPLLEGIEPLSPPAPPPLLVPDSPAQDPSAPHLVPAVQKVPIEQKDSLIEAIASHDKTTLKKVTKQTRPVSSKPLDDREVLLEQIRTRSFSLRHTVVVKHNIPRPVTNINVAAILEKANAIRQAFVGSDEDDDDDDWSDA